MPNKADLVDAIAEKADIAKGAAGAALEAEQGRPGGPQPTNGGYDSDCCE